MKRLSFVWQPNWKKLVPGTRDFLRCQQNEDDHGIVAGNSFCLSRIAEFKGLPWRRQDCGSGYQKGSGSSLGYAGSALKFSDRKCR
jgi:hypothetical protein